MKKDKRTNNDLQKTTQNIKISTRIPLNTRVDFDLINSSCLSARRLFVWLFLEYLLSDQAVVKKLSQFRFFVQRIPSSNLEIS